MQNREDDIFKDGSGRLERFLIPDMNIELIEIIARGRNDQKAKKQPEPGKPSSEHPSRKESLAKGNPDLSKDVTSVYKGKDEILGASIDHSEGDRDEEAYLDKILNDNQYLIDLSSGENRLKRQGTLMSGEHEAQGSAEDPSQRIKEQEQARQEALYRLYNQVVLDRVVKEEKETGLGFHAIVADAERIAGIKLDCIRGFKALQALRLPPKVINDHSALEEMFKARQKKAAQDEKVRDLMGNLAQKGREGVQVSQSLISLSGQLQPGFSGASALPPSRLMDLNRRNKLLSTHESLHDQIQQSARYLYSSKAKLDKLTQAHQKLVEAYHIKKEQIVEKIRRINKCTKRLREKSELRLLDKEEMFASPQKRHTKQFRDFGFGDYSRMAETGKEGTDSELTSPLRPQDSSQHSAGNLKQTNSDGSRPSPRKTKVFGTPTFTFLEEGSEDEELFGEGAKQMVKRYLAAHSGGDAGHLNDVIYEILKGDLKRTKLMTEKQLSDLVEHQRENLSIKKDYLQSLARYVASLEDALQKAQRKQRNMFLFLLEHPKDIT